MTTEEIEKAVEEYAESLKSIAFENLSGEEIPYLLRGAFKEGLESANKHWQEKTRWIPVEERLPKAITRNTNVSRQVLIKLKDSGYRVMQYDHLAKRFFPQYVNEVITHWKEIEKP
jgi:superfamily II RNA helicase